MYAQLIESQQQADLARAAEKILAVLCRYLKIYCRPIYIQPIVLKYGTRSVRCYSLQPPRVPPARVPVDDDQTGAADLRMGYSLGLTLRSIVKDTTSHSQGAAPRRSARSSILI